MPEQPLTDFLRVHATERQSLLTATVALLEADQRILAVWLHGSAGGPRHDVWSDLDLWIVVADGHFDAVATERQAFAEQVGEPLLVVEAPQNAPSGGAYLLMMYPGKYGPQILDCTWQRASSASRPAGTVLLMERLDGYKVRAGDPARPVSPGDRIDAAAQQAAFFWMMCTVCCKYIARRDSWRVLEVLRFQWSILQRIRFYVDERPDPPSYRDQPDFAPPVAFAEQLAALRGLIQQLEGLVSHYPFLATQYRPATPNQIAAFLHTVERSQGL
jgi:hypothetical protein